MQTMLARTICRIAPVLVGLLLYGCSEQAPPSGPAAPPPAPLEDLVNEAQERGVDYRNRSGGPEKATILEANGAGVAMIDLGADGDLDLVFGQGLASLKEFADGGGADLEVFENDGQGRFARLPGPGLKGWWTGLAVGDVDNDGDQDLIAAAFGALWLLRQDQGALLPEPLPLAAHGEFPAWPTSLALFDADGDGALDLYVGLYLDFDPRHPPLEKLGSGALAIPCRWKGLPVFCGPRGLQPQTDRLYAGDGKGGFVDRSAQWLVDAQPGFALAVAAFDADSDGDTDVFVANDSSPNNLWINQPGPDGQPRFVDLAMDTDVALSADGMAQAGMGAASGDVNRDGRPDLAVTNFSDEATELYFGSERGFTRMTHRLALARETRALLSWSVHLADFDGDGWLELFTTNGHVFPQADAPQTGTSYHQQASLFRLQPELRRVAGRDARSVLEQKLGARGSALGDLDQDGRVDLVLARIDGPCALAMNHMGAANRRLSLELRGALKKGPSGRVTPRDGRGAKAIVVLHSGAEEYALIAESQTSCGYQSSSTLRLHFGLGNAQGYRAIKLLWPSGTVEELPAGAGGRSLAIEEGRGIVREERLR
ncbi:MAG: hypothetical protein RL277_1462 [Planctomycetota bacterium]|jgi:hypothetical protein